MKDDGGYISTRMEGNGRAPAVGMPKLLVRAALADFYETQRFQQGDHFSWL